jgi:predicted nucleic acid-binding protein
MPVKVFLDTNVFIYAFEFPSSNSAIIIERLNLGELQAVVSELVVLEVMRYFKKYYGKDLASKFRDYLIQSCNIVPKTETAECMKVMKGTIKNKDLEHLASVKVLGLKYLISYDEDFLGQEEYIIPKDFVTKMGWKCKKTDF